MLAPEEQEEIDGMIRGLRQPVKVRLQAEALTSAHKLCHLPKNPYCNACCRGKMKQKYSKRRTFKRELDEWGEVVTCDHVCAGEAEAIGIDGQTEAFVVKDLWSGLIHAYLVHTKQGIYVMQSLKAFCGNRLIQTLYSDNAE